MTKNELKKIKVKDIEQWKFSKNASGENAGFNNEINVYDFLKSKYKKGCIFGIDNLSGCGCYKIMGWQIDFKPFLKKFLVKQYGQITEMYALNKTDVRNITYGRIDWIKEF